MIKRRSSVKFLTVWPLYAMVAPGIVLALLFHYFPMFWSVMAFQDFKPWLGFESSPWVGLKHFEHIFEREDSMRAIWNTLWISGFKVLAGLFAPMIFAILLNEVRAAGIKRSVQTLVYLPHFLSWVILGGILIDLLGPKGLLNQSLGFLFGVEPISFLSEGNWFRFTVVVSDVWKEFGFSTIVFLAALTAINPSLYEAAEMDGANRWKQTIHITVPGMLPIAVVVLTLSLGNILNAGFDQIYNLYNPLVYDKGDIIDTFVYRMGLVSSNGAYSFATAVGLFKSVIGLLLIAFSYRLAYRIANYRIF